MKNSKFTSKLVVIIAIFVTMIASLTLSACGVITDESAHTVHTAGEWIVDQEATCTTVGTQHKECIECGKLLETATIPMTEHTEAERVVNATCTAAGSNTTQ